jgi:hypothetical protein
MILALSCAVFAQTSAVAKNDQPGQAKSGQAQHPETMSPEAMMDHLSTQLNLTEEQRVKIKPIVEDVFEQMDQVRQDSSIAEQERHEKMKQIHENAISEVKPLLTADQQKKLDEMMSSHSQHAQQSHSEGGQDPRANAPSHR